MKSEMFWNFLHFKEAFVRIRQAGNVRRPWSSRIVFSWDIFLLHVQVRCTGISQAEFYAAVESLRVDGPTVWDIRWSEASSEVDDRIRFSWRHNLVLVMEWTVIRILHDLRRLFSCRKSALPAFSHTEEERVFRKDMNIARLWNGNPFRHDSSLPGRKSCVYIQTADAKEKSQK